MTDHEPVFALEQVHVCYRPTTSPTVKTNIEANEDDLQIMIHPMLFYKVDEGTPEKAKTHCFYIVRNGGTGYSVHLFMFTQIEMKEQGPDWRHRALDENEQGEIKRVMEGMGYTAVGDYHSRGIAADWLKRMGLP